MKVRLTQLRHALAAALANIHVTGKDVEGLRNDLDKVLNELRRVMDALQVIYDEEPENRRRLHTLRQSDEYELPYTETEPLVSILIPTYTSYETLRDRAIPSVVAQTYGNWELVIAGDAAPPETAAVIESFAEKRIRYENLSLRGPYPTDPMRAWLVTAVPPLNAALRSARGRWVVLFADDDALRPHAVERMLDEARSARLELCYGMQNYIDRNTGPRPFGEFPPQVHRFGLQGAILHTALRFFEQELADEIFGNPSDWSWIRRMLRAGVRIGFVEEIIADYYPSYRAQPGAN
jgi:glycosyltransferase involved in cell wall biosynthesis